MSERILVTEDVNGTSAEVGHLTEGWSDVSTHRRELNPGEYTALFDTVNAQAFKARWESIQTSFVDDPRRAVKAADTLVSEVMRELAESFSKARGELERQWSNGNGDSSSTEDLRIALRRYRSFFNRMLML